MNVETLKDEDLKWADALFISAMIVQRESFIKVVERGKQFPLTIVAGGPYPTSSWEEIQGVDHFVLGEAEDILSNFLTDLENGVASKTYAAENRPDLSNTLVHPAVAKIQSMVWKLWEGSFWALIMTRMIFSAENNFFLIHGGHSPP